MGNETTEPIIFSAANKLSFDARPQLAQLFVTGFWQWLRPFSQKPEKLVAAFTPAFQPQTFLVAVGSDNQILAMVGCPDGAPSLVLEKSSFLASLGQIRGRLTYRILKKFLIDTHYPFEILPGMGSIEFVAADPAVQGQGITKRLIEFTMQHRCYQSYVLEVASNNTRAVKLYQRLGFTELMRKPAGKMSGVGEYWYLIHRSN